MKNIALKLMYNGTAYHGWQVQKNAVTVCGTLEAALREICGGPVHLTGCGRTDAGVHAQRYIANFRTDSAFRWSGCPWRSIPIHRRISPYSRRWRWTKDLTPSAPA